MVGILWNRIDPRIRGQDRYLSIFLLLVGIGTALPALGYKFICNSIDAQGNVTQDQCGICDDASGPRWIPGTVRVKADSSVLPKGLDKAAWKRSVQKSIESWNEVPGAHLKLELDESWFRSSRGFGEVASKHEVFWITDKDEWRRKVGAGEHGALGVTTSPYFCPRSTAAREIYDADLVMNGVGDFHWRETCDGSTACNSVVSTLTHELGHFVGLGHPCKVCSWSIMSAKAAFHVKKPVFDDQEALRALYPGSKSGALGMSCGEGGGECDEGLICVEQEGAKYCAPHCGRGGACPEMFRCVESDSEGGSICKFATGRLAEVAKLHEYCAARPCADGLMCVGSGSPHFYCYEPCVSGGICSDGEACVPLQNGEGVCMELRGLDEACDHKTLCAEKLICALQGEDRLEGICHALCYTNRSGMCREGEYCSARPGLKKNRGICIKGDPSDELNRLPPGSSPRPAKPGPVDVSEDQADSRPKVVSKGFLSCQTGQGDGLWLGYFFLLAWVRKRWAV